MKQLIVFFLLFFVQIGTAQTTVNLISKKDFYNLKIGTTTLKELRDSKGDISSLKNKLNRPIVKSEVIPEEKYFYYQYDGFDICFSEDEIANFKITKANWTITINGKTVSIGSHCNDLGNPKINIQTNGGKSIVFQYCEACNNYLAFDLDKNNRIIQIEFIEMT